MPAPAEIWKTIFARPSAIPAPDGNPITPSKVALGRELFFDKRLSGDGQRSCASCHDPTQGFSDGRTTALGRNSQPLRRNTMTLWNLAWSKTLYWDGRRPSLEAQAQVPIEHPNEMAGSLKSITEALMRDAKYNGQFKQAFPPNGEISPGSILQAIATFERSLVSPETRFDRWIAGDRSAISLSAYRGFELFVGKAGCLSCHGGWRFADERFHDIGLATSDLGRGGLPNTEGPKAPRFKTPGLRELKYSAPYMHNGSMASLDEVIAHYSGGFERRPSLAANIVQDLQLSRQERNDLVAFLDTLSSDTQPEFSSSQRAE
ncbi:MAG: cytochrome c peroxidase [Pseudomonadota bacterium]